MDYEMPNGSQFSLREIWSDDGHTPNFRYTTVSAYVEGKAYCGRLDQRIADIDDADVLDVLKPVPTECLHPKFQAGFSIAPAFEPSRHHLKAPSFIYDDCQPGETFVADCFLNEIKVLEVLKRHPHPNIVPYLGCVAEDGFVTHLCLKRMASSLAARRNAGLSEDETRQILKDIGSALEHLHSLGLAHNDVNIENICLDEGGHAVLVDFDSCLPFGDQLSKGAAWQNGGAPVSRSENDYRGFDDVRYLLCGHAEDS